MRYLILMTNDDAEWDALSAAEQARVIQGHSAFEAALRSAGCWIDAWRLRPGTEARTVTRDRAGAMRVAAGPALPGPACVGGAYLMKQGRSRRRWTGRSAGASSPARTRCERSGRSER